MNRPMTYREAIQLQIKALQEIYDNAGALRDFANTGEEKAAFNAVRGALPYVWRSLQQLDNAMEDPRAAELLRGDYQLSITLD